MFRQETEICPVSPLTPTSIINHSENDIIDSKFSKIEKSIQDLEHNVFNVLKTILDCIEKFESASASASASKNENESKE
jgi:hypothetical protein